MRYQFIFTDWFDRNLRVLRKHNPSLREDLEAFFETFEAEDNPVIPGTGGTRKARMAAKGRGKRGGYRVVYYFLVNENEVWLLTIYDKVIRENLTSTEAADIAKLIGEIQATR
jgi:mRNA-degrading endonuclease RelE of RelBE toxin-antitoxin system